MSDTNMTMTERDEIEMLLPWFVTGKLDAGDQRRVEIYLAAHPEMRAQLALIEAEQSEAVHNNEAAGTPNADALSKLMARIEAGNIRAAPLAAISRAIQSALDWLGSRSALVPVAAAVAVALIVQAGAIGTLLWQRPAPGKFQTASAVATAAADKGAYVLAGFAPTATAEQIEKTLAPLGITIADGPKAGGVYRLRLAEKALGETERDMLLTALKSNSGVVRFVAPASP